MHTSDTAPTRANVSARLRNASSLDGTIRVFIAVIIFLFLAFLLAQHAMVFPYHDDWGVAVLDYVGEQTGFDGQRFTLSQAVAFLAGMYENWSGRIVSLFIEIYLLKSGIWSVRIFQIACIIAVLYYSLQIANNNSKTGTLSPVTLLPVVLYLALPPEIMVGGVYWFAASAGYLWGFPLFLFAASLVITRQRFDVTSSLALAFASTFHEQVGLAAVVFFVSYHAYLLIKGMEIPSLVSLSARFLPLLMLATATIAAPGNFARKRASVYENTDMRDVLISNFDVIANKYLAADSVYFWLQMLALLTLLSCLAHSRWTRMQTIVWRTIPAALILLSYALLPHVLFVAVFYVLFTALLFRACDQSANGAVVFSLLPAALASLAPLLVAPVIAPRSAIPFHLLLLAPIIFAITKARGRWIVTSLTAAALLVIIRFAVADSAYVFNGYLSNYETNRVNNCQLLVAKYQTTNNANPPREVTLYKLPNPAFAETMPYQRPLIEKWMKKYYELPPETVFNWQKSIVPND